jgi:DNA primase
MPTRIDDEILRRLRNDIPIDWLIQFLQWPCKRRDGKFLFLCPLCNETDSDVKRDTNLGRCFHCEVNFNPIDFTIHARQCDFLDAVDLLQPLLDSNG